MSKDIILTGIRSNEEPTLGNYIGAILPMVKLQHEKSSDYQINMFVPDLHSFTTPISHENLYLNTIKNLKYFMASGLDINNKNTYIYRQSYISAHSEMAWILSCFTGFGEASRMIEFKDKSRQIGDDRVSVGLFNYPILMAADILLYDARWVPVGEDQRQHLELTRTLAERINNKFGDTFVVPQPINKQTEFAGNQEPLRIRSLRNPDKKMSKSISDPAGTILLSDNPKEAAKKVMSATTDSVGVINYDFSNQPGVSNLLVILSQLNQKDLSSVISNWVGKNSYGELKKEVAVTVESFLTEFQNRYSNIDESNLHNKLVEDELIMNKIANLKLNKVQQLVGIRPA